MDNYTNNENCVEFLNLQRTMTVSFCSQKWINKIKKYAESHPDQVKIIANNEDGSICAHIPTKWLKISPPRQGREMTEEEKDAARERLRLYREGK